MTQQPNDRELAIINGRYVALAALSQRLGVVGSMVDALEITPMVLPVQDPRFPGKIGANRSLSLQPPAFCATTRSMAIFVESIMWISDLTASERQGLERMYEATKDALESQRVQRETGLVVP